MPPGSFFPDVHRPDLPWLPPGISVAQLGRLQRFLEARDGRRGLRGSVIQFEEPDVPGPLLRTFTLGAANSGQEAVPLKETTRLVLKSGEVLTASGHRLYGLLALYSGGGLQHWDTMYVLPHPAGSPPNEPALISESDPALEGALRLLKTTGTFADLVLLPYAYRYFDTGVSRQDPHVAPVSGWSDNGRQVMEEVWRRTFAVDD